MNTHLLLRESLNATEKNNISRDLGVGVQTVTGLSREGVEQSNQALGWQILCPYGQRERLLSSEAVEEGW